MLKIAGEHWNTPQKLLGRVEETMILGIVLQFGYRDVFVIIKRLGKARSEKILLDVNVKLC